MTAVAAIPIGAGPSRIERITHDGAPEELWTSNTEMVYALLWSDRLLVATGQEGRLLALDSLGRPSIVLDLSSTAITALAATRQGVAIGTSDRASVWLASGGPSKIGAYLTPVVDAGHFATWGRVTVEHEGDIAVTTRSGNTQSPEDHWSPWKSSSGDVASPSARFLQVKVELSGDAAVRSLEVAYLPRNLPPRVRSITILAPHLALASDAPPASVASGLRSHRSSVAREARPAPSEEAVTGARSLHWDADDPNQDALRFAIHFRGDRELEWKLLGKDLADPFHTFDGTALPDGRYEVRVTASDGIANAAKSGLAADLTSERMLIDNTPPRVEVSAKQRGGKAHLNAAVADGASTLRWAELSIDGAPWQPLLPDDRVLDEHEENFSHDLEGLSAGEHTAILRVEDDGGNVGSGKAVWRTQP